MAIPSPDLTTQVVSGADKLGYHMWEMAAPFLLAATPLLKRALDDLHSIASSLMKLTSKLSGDEIDVEVKPGVQK